MLLLQILLIFHALRNDQISGADTGFFPVGGGGGERASETKLPM